MYVGHVVALPLGHAFTVRLEDDILLLSTLK